MVRTARRLGLAVGIGLGLAAGALADGPAAAPPAVERLIEQLGSRDFKAREAAGRALLDRGEEALPAMRKAQAHPDPEVRQRLAQLIADTERAVLLAPKRVTLKLDHVPLRDALAELTRQTGYRIEVQGGNAQKQLVSLRAENVTFWEAFDKLCTQGGLVLQQHHDLSGGLIVYPQDAFVPFVDYRGPFRLAAGSFHYNKSLSFATLPRTQLAGGQRSEQLTFMFSVVAEPKLPVLGLGQPRLTAAVDDQDGSLVPPPARTYESFHSGYYGPRILVLQTQVQLTGYGGGARTLKLIRGTLPVTLLAEQKPEVVVEDILKVKHRKFDGKDVSLEIDEAKEGPNKTYQVVMTVRRAGKDNQYDYTWTNSLQQRIELADDKGNKFQSHGFNWSTGTPTSVQGTYMFGDATGKLGKPHKLTYYGWVTVQHQVEFEFRDLPLP
jgi:hypothetical protein